MIGYEYLFKGTDNFSMVCYDKNVNYLVDNEFNGEFTIKNINDILKILNREPYEKWFGTIDELLLLRHFMNKKGVDKIIVISRDIKLFGDD